MAATTVALLIVAPNDDISLSCTTSLLRLQQAAAQRLTAGAPAVLLDLHITASVDEALQHVAASDAGVGAIIHANIGFPHEFILDAALQDTYDLVLGAHPLPRIDWEAVHTRGTQEAGINFNVAVHPDATGRYRAIIPEKSINVLDMFVVKRDALPKNVVYVADEMVDGVRVSASQRFLGLFRDETVAVDVEHQCTRTGSAEFAGCVGYRGSHIR